MAGLTAGELNRRVRIERPVPAAGFDAAGSGEWEHVITVWCSVQDVLPSRAERLGDGINITARPSRVRIRYRTGITSDMRMISDGRIMQIVAGPAILGNREGLEFMVEEYRPAGNPA